MTPILSLQRHLLLKSKHDNDGGQQLSTAVIATKLFMLVISIGRLYLSEGMTCSFMQVWHLHDRRRRLRRRRTSRDHLRHAHHESRPVQVSRYSGRRGAEHCAPTPDSLLSNHDSSFAVHEVYRVWRQGYYQTSQATVPLFTLGLVACFEWAVFVLLLLARIAFEHED